MAVSKTAVATIKALLDEGKGIDSIMQETGYSLYYIGEVLKKSGQNFPAYPKPKRKTIRLRIKEAIAEGAKTHEEVAEKAKVTVEQVLHTVYFLPKEERGGLTRTLKKEITCKCGKTFFRTYNARKWCSEECRKSWGKDKEDTRANLDTLTREEQALVLRSRGLLYIEIAAILDVREDTVGSMLSRAKAKLTKGEPSDGS